MRRYGRREDGSAPGSRSTTRQGAGRVALVAGLPSGGSLDVRGTLELHPLAAALRVVANNLDVALARAYLPPSTPVTVRDGRIATDLALDYTRDGSLRLTGDLT